MDVNVLSLSWGKEKWGLKIEMLLNICHYFLIIPLVVIVVLLVLNH